MMETLIKVKYDWNNCKIIGNSPEKLYKIATVKVALSLWYAQEDWFPEDKVKVQIEICEKIASITIPETTKMSLKQMVEFIKSQLDDLLRLLRLLHWEFEMLHCLKNKICWTQQGTIDLTTTAETLADATDLKMEMRFVVAIKFCLEDRVNSLSIHIPPDYFEKNPLWLCCIKSMERTSIARKHFNVNEFTPDYLKCFELMLRRNNFTACQYFWPHLNDEEKLTVFEYAVEKSVLCNFECRLVFLFTQFDNEGKLKILHNEKYCCLLLKQLLNMNLHWLCILETCIEDILDFLKVDFVVQILRQSVLRVMLVEFAPTYKKKLAKFVIFFFNSFLKRAQQLLFNQTPIECWCKQLGVG